MIHKVILLFALMASAFGGVAAEGEDSIRGLHGLLTEEVQNIRITLRLVVPDSAESADVEALLNNAVLPTLNGDFSTIVLGPATGTVTELNPFSVLPRLPPTRRRLGAYSGTTVGSCTRCKTGRGGRRGLDEIEGKEGPLRTAVKQWCQKEGATNLACGKGRIVTSVTYELTPKKTIDGDRGSLYTG
jgi:hypothetical protein